MRLYMFFLLLYDNTYTREDMRQVGKGVIHIHTQGDGCFMPY